MGSSNGKLPPAKCDGHRYCGSADISFLNLSRDHVIKRSSQVTILPTLVAIGIAEVKI